MACCISPSIGPGTEHCQIRAHSVRFRLSPVLTLFLRGQSAAVTSSLRRSSFDAVNLGGGMCAWAAAGLSVVNDDGAQGWLFTARLVQPGKSSCEASLGPARHPSTG